MSRTTRELYARMHKGASVVSLAAFLAFLMLPLHYRQLGYLLLGASIVFLVAAAVLKILMIRGVPLTNDLPKIQAEAAAAAAESASSPAVTSAIQRSVDR
jgi:hypothetical protein